MGNTGFAVVIIVIVIALAAGYLYSTVGELSRQLEIAQTEVATGGERVTTLEAENARLREQNQRQGMTVTQLQEENHRLQATQVAGQAGCKPPRAGQAAQPAAGAVAPTPEALIPVNGGVSQRTLPTWATTLGCGLIGVIVFAAYRKFRVQDEPEDTAQRKPTRSFASDETIYVKMTRQDARDYARSRAKGK